MKIVPCLCPSGTLTLLVIFSNEIKSVVEYILQSPAITDSTIHAKEYNEMLREVYAQSTLQNFMMQGFSGKFNMENFHRRKKNFATPNRD